MNIPDDLKADPSRRGPVGAELMGVSIALPLKETMDPNTGAQWTTQDWRDFVAYAQPQLLERLRVHVGGARFLTEPQANLDGPHSDPLQGQLYVFTVAAWFMPATLPVNCPAYQARSSRG